MNRLFTKVLYMLAFIMAGIHFPNASYGQWSHHIPITVTNNANQVVNGWQLPVYINTATLVGSGMMQASGSDIRFCDGTNFLPYYIDSGMNSTKTKIWVKIDMQASAVSTIYMLYNNSTATTASTLSALNGPFSSTNQYSNSNSGGVTNSQRGFRFSPNRDILVSSFGKNEPNGTTRFVTLFDWNTQAQLEQQQVSGNAGVYSYQQLSSPRWLTPANIYTIQIYQGATDGYYFSTSSQVNSAISYLDLRYCNSCTENTFPTNVLTNMHYGYVDFEFYTVDTNNITNIPTYTVGTPAASSINITQNPVSASTCDGGTATFSVVTSGSSLTYQWQLSTNSSTWSNISNGGVYSDATTPTLTITGATTSMHGNLYRCLISNSTCLSLSPVSSTVTLNVGAIPTLVSTKGAVVCHNTTAQISATPSTGHVNWYDSATGGTLLHTGNTFNIANATRDTSFYAEANSGIGDSLLANVGGTAGNEGAVFEIVPKQNIKLTDITWTAGGTGLYDIRVYIKAGGYTADMTNAAAWTLIGSDPAFTASNNVAYKLNLSSPQILQQGQTYSIYVVNADLGLRNVRFQSTASNTMGNIYSEDNALQIKVGSYSAVSSGNPFNNSISNDYAFTGIVWYELTNCASARTLVNVKVGTPPTITATQGDSICIGNYSTAVATPSTGNTIQWYNANSGGIPITYGDTLHTPMMHTTRDYYAQAVTYLPDSLLTRTTFNSNSRGFAFDMLPQKHLRLTDITWIPQHTGAYDMKVYITWGSMFGKMTNQGMWELAGDFSNHSATAGVPNKLHLPTPQYLDAGQTYGIYIVNTHTTDRYISYATGGTTGVVVAQDGNLQVMAGFGVATGQMPFVNGVITNREFTGTLWYDTVGCSSPTRTPVTIYVDQQPTVTADPQNDTVCAGTNTIFTVGSYGTDLTYQWQVHNGTAWANVSGGIYSGENTDTLIVTNATVAVNNHQYRCIIDNTKCNADTSASAIITIIAPANITTQPVATRTICVGGNTNYSVVATGSSLSYQWQVYNGTAWANATGGVYSNDNTNTLTITAATSAIDGYTYRCIVSNTTCNPDTSNTGSLTVETAPAIITDPITHTICTGTNTTFTVAATGSNLSYQWQVYNGTAWNNATGGIYSGGSTNTLTLTNATTAVDNYQYRCVVSNTACTAATSATATLTIDEPANITTQPVATRTICVGANTTYTVAATGSNLNYQWEMYDGTTWNNVNGPVYSGANTNTLTITAATAAQDGQYRCTISNTSCAPVVSNTADLTVNIPPAITTDPQTSRIICAGATTSFNIVATGTNLVYNWETNNGTSTWSTVNGAMYSGVNTNTLSITGPTFGMNGYLYRCVVTNTGCALKVSKIGTLTVQEPPAVTTQPQATRTICAGNNTTFSVAATGTSISYQWEVFNGTTWSNANGGLYTGSNTNTLTITNATAAENGYQYRCAISSPTCATLNSNPGTLTVETAPAITTDPVSRIVCEGGSTTFNVVATGTNLTYQWERSGNGTVWLPLTNGTAHTGVNTTTLSLPNVTGGLVYKYYRCVVSGSCPPTIVSNPAELEIRIAPSITNQPQNVEACVGKPVRFTILASGSQLTYRWQISTNGGTNWNFLSEAGIYSGTNTPILNISTVALSANNYKYKCIVSGYCPSPVTTNIATLTVNTYVAVTSQPIKADTICSGGNINLSVGATGSGITYEWYLNKGNGDPIEKLADNTIYSGTNTANLTGTGIVVTEKTHTYTYSCLVIGTCSTVRTDLSKITIYAPPAVRQQPLSVDKCDKTRRTQFSIRADGTAIAYQWQESADGGNTWNPLANGVNYNYVNTNTLEIFEVDLSMHNYQYRCVVTGICGTPAASNAARLVVNPLLEPQVTITASSNDICAGTSVTFTPTPTAGGSSPTYQWRVNSTNVATGATYTTSSLANNDFVSCIMTSNAVCKTKTTASSNYEYVKVTPRTNASVSITSNVGTSWCSGKDAIFTATPVNGGNAPAFEWTVNGASTGVTTQQFTTMLNNGDEVQCLMTSSIKCATPAVAASNKIKMIINPTSSASVLISPNPDSVICSEDEVLMYVAFTNGGSLPKFQWMLNGVDMPGETNATLKTTKIKQDDMVNCRLISSNTCVFPEVSNGISFDVNSRLKPEVRLQSSFMGNNTYTFTASAVNEGTNPSYVWFRNGTLQSTLTGPVQTFENLSTVERIHVQLVSSEACIIKGLEVVSSNVITTTSVATTEKLFNSITLHPNPGTGDFTINGTLNTKILNKEVLIKITNSVGQTVYQQQHYIKDNNIHLPISLGSHLVGGMYMVTLIADNDMFSMKYILSR